MTSMEFSDGLQSKVVRHTLVTRMSGESFVIYGKALVMLTRKYNNAIYYKHRCERRLRSTDFMKSIERSLKRLKEKMNYHKKRYYFSSS